MSCVSKKVIRQDIQTEIPELVGFTCDEIIGVGRHVSTGFTLFFISIADVKYKFFIDEDVLFWQESEQEPEDDLDNDEYYIDLLEHFNIQPNCYVKTITMKCGKLNIILTSIELEFYNSNDATFVANKKAI